MHSPRGFVWLPVLGIIAAIFAVSGGAYWYVQSAPEPVSEPTNMSAPGSPSAAFKNIMYPSNREGFSAEQISLISDPPTFSIVTYMKTAGMLNKDKDHVYWITYAEPLYDLSSSVEIIPADAATFEAVRTMPTWDVNTFSKDKNTVFCFGFPIPGVDPSSAQFSFDPLTRAEYVADRDVIWESNPHINLYEVRKGTLETVCKKQRH